MMAFPSGMTVIGSVVAAAAVMTWRVREARSPVTLRRIVIPPLGMATGLSMFLLPACRVPWTWAGMALLMGAGILAYPLLLTSRLARQGDAITMRRSHAFFAVTLALAAIRLGARGYLDTVLSMPQTASVFYLLAFGMIVRWRVAMLFEYRELAGGSSNRSHEAGKT